MMYLDVATYLTDDILCKLDRAAMFNSLETRVPFLNEKVVEFAWKMPIDTKIKNGTGKWPLKNILSKYNLEKDSRLGYSIGIGYPPDWGEHTMSIRKNDMTVLQPNLTFHMIAGMWMDTWGLEISESIRVTENGCELFCDFPRSLHLV